MAQPMLSSSASGLTSQASSDNHSFLNPQLQTGIQKRMIIAQCGGTLRLRCTTMATTKPRVNITFEPEDYEVLKRVSETVGVSMASLVRDYVQMSRPLLERLAGLGEAFREASEQRKATHREAVKNVMDRFGPSMEEQIDTMQGSFEELFSQLIECVGTAREPSKEGGSAGTPDSSNTGVRSEKQVQSVGGSDEI